MSLNQDNSFEFAEIILFEKNQSSQMLSNAYNLLVKEVRGELNSKEALSLFLHILISLKSRRLSSLLPVEITESKQNGHHISNWLNSTAKENLSGKFQIPGYNKWLKFNKIKINDDVILNIIRHLGIKPINLFNRKALTMPTSAQVAAWFELTLDAVTVDATGSVYTPYDVIDLMIKDLGILDSIKNGNSCKLMDPTMGSGKFLISALNSASSVLPRSKLATWVLKNVNGADCNSECVDFVKWLMWYELSDASEMPDFSKNFRSMDSLKLIEENIAYDFVIGNPPYLENKKLNLTTKSYIKTHFKTATGQYDISVPFMELGIAKSKCGFSFIVTNKFLTSEYGELFRQYLLNNDWSIRIFNTSAIPIFSNASVYTVILSVEKNKKSDVIKFVSISGILKQEEVVSVPKKFFSGLPGSIIPTGVPESHFEILEYLGKFEVFPREKVYCGLAQTGLTKKLTCKGGRNFIGYLSGTDLEPLGVSVARRYLPQNLLPVNKLVQFAQTKVLVPGLIKEMYAAVDKGGNALGRVYYFFPKEIGFSEDVLVALFNSDLYKYLFKLYFGDAHLAGGYIRVNSPIFQIFPLPSAVDDKVEMKLKKAILKQDFKNLNEIVFELFGIKNAYAKKITQYLDEVTESIAA